MMEIKNNFLKTNWRYLLLIIGGIAVTYLNYYFVTRPEFNELKKENKELKEQFLVHTQKNEIEAAYHDEVVATNKRRLENKIKVQGEQTKQINAINIKQAIIETKLEFLTKEK